VPLVWVYVRTCVPGYCPIYRGDYLFSTEVVKNRSPRSSCRHYSFILSDERKINTLRLLPHLRLIPIMSQSAPASEG
jgi:hypothetical protein